MESLPGTLRCSQGNLSFLKVLGFHIRIFRIELLKFTVSIWLNLAFKYAFNLGGHSKKSGGSGSISKHAGRSLDITRLFHRTWAECQIKQGFWIM